MAIVTACLCYDIIAIIVTLVIGGIAYMKWKFTYWEKMGVPTLTPTIPFGTAKDLMLGRLSFGEQFREVYRIMKEKGHQHAGFYIGPSPGYVPIDPEIIKHIMQTDFQHFNSHGGFLDEETDPLSGHLFNLEDVKWRNLRVKLTPTFTSGKMKMMFQTIAIISDNLKKLIDDSADNDLGIDIRDILSRFGTDVIGSVAFGLECDSLKDPDAPFRTFGKKASEMDFWDTIKIFMQVILPHWFLHAIKHKFTKRDVEEFFMKVVRNTVEYREKNNYYRKDFMHLLLQLKNRGTVADDEQIKDETGESKEVALTMNQLAAQAYVFFMAGYETSSTTVTFALYELAVNSDIQSKLREEVNSVLARHDNKMTYEAVMEMTFMEKVLFETLRKYPPLPILTRLCTKDYIIPGTDVQLNKGVGVMIPVLGLHSDPEYYPNPDIFDPERFSEENKQSRPSFTWLPFGDGPRICIGMRFGILQSKVALATFVKNYDIKLNKRTLSPLQFDKRAFVSRAAGGVWLDVTKLT
ncbi:hypothetical protein Zmor_010962 [Zophobas morio]|uniref:Cytochrome P450 n=1 Tax=Zophobas morio TaxID=2755281 RepID=A0AA38ISC4_9CUCU|nr:hypothetical protein Zmor_010962 [Zophobas morio]